MSNEQKYEPFLDHIKRMLVSYIHEVVKLDQAIDAALRKNPSVKPIGKVSDVNKMSMDIVNRCKSNDHAAKKIFNDMTSWYLNFRRTILAMIPNLFKTIKKNIQVVPD